MTAGSVKQNAGWAVALSLIGTVGGLCCYILFEVKGDMKSMHMAFEEDMKELKKQVEHIRIDIAGIKSNRFTSADGQEIWKAQSQHLQMAHPPIPVQLQINGNTAGVKANTERLIELNKHVHHREGQDR